EKRFDQYALDIQMPEPLVPRPLRFGLNERVLADGSVLVAPQDDDIEQLADRLKAENIEAVALGFLHSYHNASHEAYVAERLQALLGDKVTICQSAEVAGEIREYERFSTVCANAYVRPVMARYLQQLQSQLQDRGFGGSLLMMLSVGGLTTLEQAVRFPIRLLESGPAGGVALAAHVAREVGSRKTLSLDIGGTTAKICFIENGLPKTTRRFEVARAWRDVKGSGLPVRIPTVELVEIGAGGGSIASIDALGRLKVGPRSAGSDPGPAAYGRGGEEATITDSHLTVGNISADGFAGGMIKLAPDRAPAAIAKHVQDPMGIASVEPAAAGIIELADETMANAARVHGVELGLDVASFDLLVSGGGGALHAARIAEKLGIRRIIVPQDAGVGSAVGFLRSPVAFESVISVISRLDEIDTQALTERVHQQLESVRSIVEKAVHSDRITTVIKAELRYQGQGLELFLDLPEGGDFAVGLSKLEALFQARYKTMVGFNLNNIPVELVSISVSAREALEVNINAGPQLSPTVGDARTRNIYDLKAKQFLAYSVVDRTALDDSVVDGPAVVSEAQTTTLVRPDWTVHRLDSGDLVLERSVA
ncbi:MAG: hydantoinase/oxoprolinase family protein, partial [Hyphomicrobiales bacterium]